MTQTNEQQRTTVQQLLANLADPYPVYAQLRAQEQILYSPELDSWLVSRYEDVRSILAAPAIFSSSNLRPPLNLAPAALAVLMQGYPVVPVAIDSDGLNHQRFRSPHVKGFSAASMKAREQAIRALANRLVDSFINDGHAEFIGQFTYPLSLETILRLLGIPQNHMEEVKEWGRNMTDLLFGSLESEERQVECAKGFVAFQHYVADLVEQRRQHPQNDELDALINYQVPGAEPLSQLELVNAVTGFLTVGHRTTLDACGNGFKLLLQNPELWQTLCVQPELIPATVEEIIRYEPSVQTLSRITTQEVVIGNVTLPAGAKLLILLGSANRDEQHIPNAHTFDIHRNPNHHIAFGHGIHFCVGAPAARLEMRIALETFTQRLPTLRLAPDQTFSYNPLLIFRGLQKLDVIW